MAIPPQNLELWTGNEQIGGRVMGLDWQARHTGIGEVVNEGTLTASVAKVSDLVPAWNQLVIQAGQQLENTRAYHEPIASIGDYSLFDVDLILDGWLTDGHDYVHPVCGTVPGPIPSTLPGRLAAILAARLPPPLWFWAESVAAGELRIKCVAVAGADSYDVYDGETLLGNVPSSGWQTISVAAGSYSVRMGAVDGGQVGILSFPVGMEVA